MPLECSICIEPLHTEPIATTECGHIFHNSCIQEWFRKDHNKCPLCNKKFSHRKPFIPLYIDLRQDNDGDSNNNNYNNNSNNNNNVIQTASEAHLKLKQQYNALSTEYTYINQQLKRTQHSFEEVQKQNHLYHTKIRRLRSIQKIVDIEGKFALPAYQAKLQRWQNLHKEELLDMLFSATFKVDELNKELNRKYDRISQLKERLKLAKERASSNSGTRNNRLNAPTSLSLDEELNNNKRRGKQPVAVLQSDNDSTDEDDRLITVTRSNSVNNQNTSDRKRTYASVVENGTDEDETDDDTNAYNLRQRGEPNLTRNKLFLNNPLIPTASASTTPALASTSASTSASTPASTGYHSRKRRQSSYSDESTNNNNNNNNRNGHNVFSTRSRNNWPSRYNHTGDTLKRSRIIPTSTYLFNSNNSNNNYNNNTRPIVYDLTTDEESNNSNDENEDESFEFERNSNHSVTYNEEREEETNEEAHPSPNIEYYRRPASANPYVIELSSEEEEEDEHDHRYAIRV